MDDHRSLRDELAHEARHLPLTSTGVEVIIETAGRRRRRRNIAAIGSVLAVTAVTVVGIQQLSRVEPEVALTPPETVVPAATTVPAEAVTSTTLYAGAPQSVADLSGAVPAELSAPVMTWTVIDADGPQALALRYGNADQRYALVTEPGSADSRSLSLYEQREGEWVAVASNVLPDGLRQATVSGDEIYAVGTAPATAGAAQGSVGRYDVAAQEWQLLPLPEEARPYRSDAVRSSAEMSITAIDGGALVLINRGQGSVDYQAVQSVIGTSTPMNDFRWVDGRLEVTLSCDYEALDQVLNSLEQTGGPEADFDAAYRQAMAENCTIRTLSAAELGLSAADQAELDRPSATLMYRYDGETLTPVESPVPAGELTQLYRNVLTTWSGEGGQAWLVQPDGTFEQIFPDLGTLDGTFIREYDGVLATGMSSVIVTGAPGAETRLVDVSGAVADDTMINPMTWVNSVAANQTATVAAVAVEFEPVGSVTEPVTISGSEYDLVVDPVEGVTVIERATGRTLSSYYRLATEPGSLRLMTPSDEAQMFDEVTATTVQADVPVGTSSPVGTVPFITAPPFEAGNEQVIDQFDVDWTTLSPWSHTRQLEIVSSVDGRSYAVESFADLIDTNPGESAEVSQVDIVDGRFLVRGWVWDGSGNGRNVILIGTPNG